MAALGLPAAGVLVILLAVPSDYATDRGGVGTIAVLAGRCRTGRR